MLVKQDSEALLNSKRNIKKGFKWIGIGSMVSQAFDVISFFIVVMFISKPDMGLATLAVGFGALMEAFNGMGVGVAFVQDTHPTKQEAQSLFWFSSGFGVLLFLVSIPISLLLSLFYNSSLLFPLLLATFVKLVFVCVGEIPIQTINRKFNFHHISIIQMSGTFAGSVLKVLLSFLGFGAWALVIANTMYGVVSCILSIAFSRFKPELHFCLGECRRFISFGIKHCIGLSIEHFNRNLHYFIIGKFCGESLLGLYRVAYEFAMTPALALFKIVNKSSFPIFATLKDNRAELAKLFSWNQKNIAIFCAVPIVFIYYCAIDIFTLQGIADWFDALVFILPVLILSLFRSLSQTFTELYRSCGKPELSLYVAAFEAAVCFIVFSAILTYFEGINSILILLYTLIVIFMALLVIHYRFGRRFVDITPYSIPLSFLYAFIFFAICFIPSEILQHFRDILPWHPWVHIVGQVLIIAACLFVYARLILKVSLRRRA